jgi:hypothetical protein
MVPVALMALHPPTLTPCSGTLWINMGFSAIPVILRVQISSKRKTSITTKQTSVESISPAKSP